MTLSTFQLTPTHLAQLSHIAATDEFEPYDEPSSPSSSTQPSGAYDWQVLKEAIKARIVQCLEEDFGAERELELHPGAKLLPWVEEGGDVEGAWHRCNEGIGLRERAEGEEVSSDADAQNGQHNGTAQYDYMARLTPNTSSNVVHPPCVHKADAQHFYPSKRPPPLPTTLPLSPADVASTTTHLTSLLDDFDTQPPFTIQRLCELVVAPMAHYTSAKKWVGALKRCLSVTATRDAFPISPVQALVGVVRVNGHTEVSELDMDRMDGLPPASAAEPLFSPIPFVVRAESVGAIPDLELGGADRTLASSEPPRELVDIAPTQLHDQHTTPSTDESGSVAASVDAAVTSEPLGVPDGQVDELDNPTHTVEPITSTTEVPSAPPAPEKAEELKDQDTPQQQEQHKQDDDEAERSTKRRKSVVSISEE